MDEDGWKELAQLSFFVPEKDAPRGRWSREMSHDWGSLGRWTGSTIFQKGPKKGLIQPFKFNHKMKYSPTKGKKKSSLPFPISSPSFTSPQASGTVYYDTENYRVHSAQETFRARGSFRTQVLGQPAQIRINEQQDIQIRLGEEKPSWAS